MSIFMRFSMLLLLFISNFNLSMAQDRPHLFIITDTSAYRQWLQQHSRQPLQNLQKAIPHLKTELHYATSDNFTHTVLYHHPKVLATPELTTALQKAAKILQKQGLGILIFDAYRPYAVTEKMWQIVPDDRYAANPAHGSDHNRGTAVDLTLYDLKTGKKMEMPTGFDNFTAKAHHDAQNISVRAKRNRKLLLQTMQSVGLQPLSTEWWHYRLPDSKIYPVLDLDFMFFD